MPLPIPGQPFPNLSVPRLGGGTIDNAALTAPFMTVLNVYRGLHCPRCRRQMEDFHAHRAAFDAAGIAVVSISTDPEDRADEARTDWAIGDMELGYGLTIDQARRLGLYVSEAIREGETARFAEAALFMIRPDGVLWGAAVNSFPFLRPTAEMILDAVDTAKTRSYPPRGNVAA